MNKYSGWDPGVDVSDDLDIPPESSPPLRGFAHSERCAKDKAHAKALAEALRAFGERTLDDGTICYCIAGAAGPDGHEDVCSDARRALDAYDKDHER